MSLYQGNKPLSQSYKHASKHASDGTDPITPESIGAASSEHTNDAVMHIVSSEREAWNAKATPPTITSVTLTASGWDSDTKTQSVTVNGILADETKQLIQVMPTPVSMSAITEAGAYCSAQGENSLTFTCTTIPTEDVIFNIAFQEADYI